MPSTPPRADVVLSCLVALVLFGQARALDAALAPAAEPVVHNYSLPAQHCPGADVIITGNDLTTSSTCTYQCTFIFNSSSSTPSSSSSASSSSTYSSSSLAIADSATEVECPLPEEPGHVITIEVWQIVDNGTTIASSSLSTSTTPAALPEAEVKRLLGHFATSFTISAATSAVCESSGGSGWGGLPRWAWFVGGGGAIALAAALLAIGIFSFNRAQHRRRMRLRREFEDQHVPLI